MDLNQDISGLFFCWRIFVYLGCSGYVYQFHNPISWLQGHPVFIRCNTV